jgi:acyl carrier protein
MKPMDHTIGTHHTEMISVVADAIRAISSKAREASIVPGSLLLEDLALDSLDLVAVIVDIQDRFGVEIDPDEIANLRTVEDLVASINRQQKTAA